MDSNWAAMLQLAGFFGVNGFVYWWLTTSSRKDQVAQRSERDARILDYMEWSENELDDHRAALKERISRPGCSAKELTINYQSLGELDEAKRKRDQLTNQNIINKPQHVPEIASSDKEPYDPRFDPVILAGPTKISGAVFAVESLPGGGARTIRFDDGVWRPNSGADAAEIMGGVPYTLTDQDRSQTILMAAMEQLTPAERESLMTQLEVEARNSKIANDPVLSAMPRAAAIADLSLSAIMTKQLDDSESRLGQGVARAVARLEAEKRGE